MTGATASATTSASIGSAVDSQIAVGTDIRQQAIYLKVELTSGDPAAIERVSRKLRFQPLPAPVDATDKDFPNLLGREAEVGAAQQELAKPPADRRSVALFGGDGIGKTVLLRYLARRGGGGFGGGVAAIDAAGNRWQDVGQQVVQSFYEAEIAVYLGQAQLRRLLGPLEALVLLDNVAGTADIGQLAAMLKRGSVVVASTERLLPGDSRAIRLEGLGDEACVALVQATLDDLGVMTGVDAAAAARIGRALGGHPSRIIERLTDADGRHVTLAQLADELEAAGTAPVPAPGLAPQDASVLRTVAALDGAPVGPEHIAAVAGVTTDAVDNLVRGRSLRVASPQLRLGVDRAATGAEGTVDGDEIRERFLAHFVRWAWARRADPAAVGEEFRAIQALLRWAYETGRYAEVLALSEATDTAMAASGRWGAWSAATNYRLQAAEALQDGKQAAIAINQLGVQALGEDEASRARDLFAKARDRADESGAAAISAVAERNRLVIDGLLAPPPTPPSNLWRIIGGGALIVLVAIAALFLLNRKAIAIEPSNRVFESATAGTDGELVTFRVTNQGSVALEGLVADVVGPEVFFVTGGDCQGASLAAGASCTIEVRFHAEDEGEYQATLTVTAQDGTLVGAPILSVAVPITPEPSVPPTPTPTPSPTPTASETPEPVRLPDIAIADFRPTDKPRQGEGLIVIPITVTVENVGDGPAGSFPIVFIADGVPVPFQIPGSEVVERLVTDAPLLRDQQLTYDGNLHLQDGTSLDTVQLVVAADTCDVKGTTPDDCPVRDAKPENNSLPLQAADIEVSNLTVGPTRDPIIGALGPLPNRLVDVAFDVSNNGNAPTGEFWIGALLGQFQPVLVLEQADIDPLRGLPQIPSIDPDRGFHFSGTVAVPDGIVTRQPREGRQLQIDAGCPVESGKCWVPEIYFDNNMATGTIPRPPAPTPTPPSEVD